ncbi:MAG: hypothetical protein HY870_11295 [Chloroflexi bacterium]|nr:hypothetical protein [Chloroflexota bacterium]
MSLSDLTVEAFLILREAFFNTDGSPILFALREKHNTQDDPLDEHIAAILKSKLTDALCQKSPGPLINPDLVLYRPDECRQASPPDLRDNVTKIVAIEVKKLERGENGQIARASGLDYNTTPPCGVIRVYDGDDRPLDIRGFYLFVCQERNPEGQAFLSALALVDGNVLNADFDLYLRITSQREKVVGLGTYGDGANRNRPMLIFANPLGASQLDRASSLVSGNFAAVSDERIGLVYRIKRQTMANTWHEFSAYRQVDDIPVNWAVEELIDPFPQPATRLSATQARGRFRLPIRFLSQPG